ncbi:hypothetical protein N9Y50_00035 [Alphaproteobacteria bacterium]|nr:hypothetical protein [Alphaproteobacteria bacterium]
MNKVKEKKLKAIKSEISEISKLVSSNTNNELEDNDHDLKTFEVVGLWRIMIMMILKN